MDLLALLGLGIAGISTGCAWALAARRGRLEDQPIGAGLGRGILVALGIGLIAGFGLPFALNVGFPVDVGLVGYLLIGLFSFGTPIAIGVFWLGALLMPLGLLLTRRRGWPTSGTWLAATIVAFLVAVGYFGYRAVVDAIEAPAVVTGRASFDIAGLRTARATGSGEVTCTQFDDGTFRVDVGIGFSSLPPLRSADMRAVRIQMVWQAGREPSLAIAIGDRSSDVGQDGQVTLAQGSTPSAGSLIVDGILPSAGGPEPDASDPWSGTVSWECPLR